MSLISVMNEDSKSARRLRVEASEKQCSLGHKINVCFLLLPFFEIEINKSSKLKKTQCHTTTIKPYHTKWVDCLKTPLRSTL